MAIDKAITDLPVATEIGDEDYLVLQQNNAAKSVRGAIVKKYAGDVFNDAKDALLALLSKVAYIDENGQEYLDELEAALMRKNVLSITAVFEQGSVVIYDTDTLDTLKQYLTVTANYDDGTSAVVTGYTLSGTLTAGTSTITVTYSGKTDTFDVNVTSYTQPGTYVLTNSDLWELGKSAAVGNTSVGKTREEILLDGYPAKMASILLPLSQNGVSLSWNANVYNIFPGFFDGSKGFVFDAFNNRVFLTSSPSSYSASSISSNGVEFFFVIATRKDNANLTASDIANLNLTLGVN